MGLPQLDHNDRPEDQGLLRPIRLTVSSLALGKNLQINQVRDEYLVFMSEALRGSMYTPVV
jgi:hypothetical protein